MAYWHTHHQATEPTDLGYPSEGVQIEMATGDEVSYQRLTPQGQGYEKHYGKQRI